MHDMELKRLQQESTKRFSELKKAYEQANRDKETMVIKYAMGEKEILLAKKVRLRFLGPNSYPGFVKL